MEQKFTFKRLMSLLVVFTMLFSSFAMFAIPAGAEVFWAEGDYTIADNGNYSASHAYGYVFDIVGVNTAVQAEKNIIVTDNATFVAGSYGWAVSVVFEQVEGDTYKVANVFVAPQQYANASADTTDTWVDYVEEIAENQIVMIAHSSASYPAYNDDGVTLKYANWQDKVAAMALANTIGAEVTLSGIDLENKTVTDATVTVQDAPEADGGEDEGLITVTGETGTWQAAEGTFGFAYKYETTETDLVVEVTFDGDLVASAADAATGNGNGTNVRLWVNYGAEKWDRLYDGFIKGDAVAIYSKDSAGTEGTEGTVALTDKTFTFTIPLSEASNGNNEFQFTVCVSNTDAEGNNNACLYAPCDSMPWQAWDSANAHTIVVTATEPDPDPEPEPDPDPDVPTENKNVAFGKNYDVTSGNEKESYAQYTANLTDGNIAEVISYDGNWFTFYNNPGFPDDINVTDGVGTVVVDLGGSYNITDLKVYTIDVDGASGIKVIKSIKAYVSEDGETWSDAIVLDIPTGILNATFAATAEVDLVANFVKFDVETDGIFGFLNEIEVYADVPVEEPTPEPEADYIDLLKDEYLVEGRENVVINEDGSWTVTGKFALAPRIDYDYNVYQYIAKALTSDTNIKITFYDETSNKWIGLYDNFVGGNDGYYPAGDIERTDSVKGIYTWNGWAEDGIANLRAVYFEFPEGETASATIYAFQLSKLADVLEIPAEEPDPEEPTPEEPESTNVLLGVAFDKLTGTYYSYSTTVTDGSELTDGYYITEENLTGALYADDKVAGFGSLGNSTLELEGALDATYAIDKIVAYYANGKTGSGICEPGTIKAFYKNGDGEWIQFGTTFESTETNENMSTRYDFLISSVEFTVDTAVEATDIRFEFTPREGKTLVFISELEAWGTEVTAEEPDPEVPALPEGAIALDYAGYVHDSYFEILAGDNKTVADLTTLGIGEAKDMNYFYVAVVGADNVITEMYTTLGRPDGVKSDVVCPEGGYIIGLNANKAGADALLAAKVGDSITLYNVDVDSFRGAEGSIALVNAGFAIVPAAVEPEQTITQWGAGAGVEVMTDYYTGVDEINTYDGFQDKLYGFGNSALEAGEYSFDLTIYESTFNTITLYALDFANGAVMLPEEVVFVIDGVEYEATINSNAGGIATIVATFDASVTATEITVKAVMGASPYDFGVFNMYTEIETSFVLPELPENVTQWGAGADIDVMTDGYNGVGEVNTYDGFQDKLYGLSNSVLDATKYSFDILLEGEYFNGITLYTLDFANGGVMLPEKVYFVVDNVYYEATITPNEAGIATITAELDEAVTAYCVSIVVEMGASPYTFPIFNMYTEIEFTYEAPGLPENVTQWGAGADVEVMTDGYNGVGEVDNYDGFQDKLYGFGNANLDPATYSFDLTFEETSFDTITLYFLDFANGGVMVPEAVKFVVNGAAYDAVITENANGIGTIVAELDSEITASEITVVVDMAASPYSFGIFNMYTEIELTKFVPADPIDVTLVEGENDITVPAGSTANATTNFENDYVITIAGNWSVTVVVNGVEYYPNRMGNLEAPLPAGENTVVFKNSAEEEAAIVAVVTAPIVGDTMDDPIVLDEAGDYNAKVDENYPQGVFYTYTATVDGTITLTITSEGGWTYVINNITAGKYGDTQWSDSDPVAPSTTLEVSVGDEIAFVIGTYDPANPFAAPVGEVAFTLTEDGGEVEPETVEIALGDVNMDGVIDQFDYILIKRAYFETIELNDAQKELADVNADGVIDQFDYILIKRHYFETFVIEGVVEVPVELVPIQPDVTE